ncbi:MAG TPA: molecular chaperone DnaK [Planctomycetaceae bacterium]|nr:molecular chaperone DnaK [Planctomycetaceae bacterium]
MATEPDALEGFEEVDSRYVVGIDLGTTNCAVSFVDSTKTPYKIENLPIDQWVDFSSSEKRPLLPSFHYQPTDAEQASLRAAGADTESVVGELARDRGLEQPGRHIQSAKSWLCHGGVDRRSAILPWQGDDGVGKLSPVDASAAYLAAIRRAWDQRFRSEPLANQEIVLTLPASFDQIARQLTIEAAASAGLPRVLPIEEPQAAFYAWLAQHENDWEQKVAAGQTILVCDIGGGTTDFTLIRVRAASDNCTDATQASGNKLSLHRVAVGQHLILGGDNIDLALAALLEEKLKPDAALTPRQWETLRSASRTAKETLLGENAPEEYVIHLPGSGAKLLSGGRQVTVTADDVNSGVLDGFFPPCTLDARPGRQQTGFQEFGLPFATDAAITKHLAEFLWEHRFAGRDDAESSQIDDLTAARPDWILFNGGVMASSQIRGRIVDVITSWFADSAEQTQWSLGQLEGETLDRAVAAGAAYFGCVRRGQGVQIEAKLASSFYLQTDADPPQAVCIVPGSASPGDSFELEELPMELSVGRPVQFPMWYSNARLADQAGSQSEITEEQFLALPPIKTVVETSRRLGQTTVPVVLHSRLSQIGTLELALQTRDSDLRWKLEFDIRGSSETDHESLDLGGASAGTLDEAVRVAASEVIECVFDKQTIKPGKLIYRLTEALEMPKSQWPPSLLRAMWDELIARAEGRRHSPAHEARWLNTLGYCLRPGYGLAADDWRVAQTWRTVHGKLAHAAPNIRNEAMILWRRIAGGFTAGQQLTVYQQVAGPLRGVLDPDRRGKGGGTSSPTELIELLRLVGSLELLPAEEKRQLGDWLLALLGSKKWQPCQNAILWTLGRMGSRQPAYAPLTSVLKPAVVEGWLRRLVRQQIDDTAYPLAIMLCSRKVGDRYRDVSEDQRSDAIATLNAIQAPAHYASLVEEGGQLQREEATEVFGDSLPLGLRIAR